MLLRHKQDLLVGLTLGVTEEFFDQGKARERWRAPISQLRGGAGLVPTFMGQSFALYPGHSQMLAVPKVDGWSVPALGGIDGDQCRKGCHRRWRGTRGTLMKK